jgi:1,2-diacylglycerol 3-beta-glucosyltransferase
MLHTFVDMCGLLLACCAVCGSCYILGFAIIGSLMSSEMTHQAKEITHYPVFIVFIPAHNEGSGIVRTIESLLEINYPRDRFSVITIADNCDDNTAEVAEQHGATVWIRSDRENPGKGQALAWGFDRACSSSFDFVVIVDADTIVHSDFLMNISRAAVSDDAMQSDVVYQGRYEFVSAGPTQTWFEKITVASKAAENAFIYRPRSRARMITLLQGNGFCIPRRVLDRVPFRSTSIVEDAEYALTLATSNVRVLFVEEACVQARMTKTIRDAAPQRLRWASGVIRLIVRSAPDVLWKGIVRRDWRLIEASLMLVLTSRLTVFYLAAASLCVAPFITSDRVACLVYVLVIGSASAQVSYVWLVFRNTASTAGMMRSIFYLPVYLAMLIVTQMLSFISAKRNRWTRTVR